MVQINLLPVTEAQRHQAKAKLKVKLRPLVFALIGIIGLIIVGWSKLGMELAAKQRQLAQLDGELKAVKSTLQKLDELKADKAQMTQKLRFLQEQLKREVLWAENLNRLSNLIPEGIWLKSLVLHTKKEGNSEKYVKLDIDGSAVSLEGKEMMDLISGFMSALKQDAVFSGQFAEIKLISSQRSKSDNIELMHFKLFCQFRQKM